MPLDESVAYYWTSLGLSAFAVVLFLWLVRAPRDSSEVRKPSSAGEAPPHPIDSTTPDPRPPTSDSSTSDS